LNTSGASVSSTRSATFDLISLVRRSRRLRVVTYLPSLPANGPLLAMNCMLIVGSSTDIGGSRRGSAMATTRNWAQRVRPP